MIKKLYMVAAICAGVSLAQSVSAATLLNPGGTVALGVNPEGHLNTTDTYGYAINAGLLGVTSIGLGDATAPGCYCEGWGVSANGTDSGYANVSVDGIVNLTVGPFLTDDLGAGAGTFATSAVSLTSMPGLKVTQSYAASAGAPGALFENKVTIENATGAALTDVKYVRVMDWDVPPTEFFEFVTIIGTATTTDLEESDNNGFSSANPLAAVGSFGLNTVDFVDAGPFDHGAYFRFNFGGLADGETKEFSIFYGAAADEAAALAALGAVGAELYSLGQNDHVTRDDEVTFIFGFKGVGGIIIVPPPGVPDAGSTFGLLGMALAGLVGFARSRK